MKALANITSSAIIAFALAVAVAPLAWGSTGSVASEVAVLLAHSDAVSATTDAALALYAAADGDAGQSDGELPVLAIPETGAPESFDEVQVMTEGTINVGGHVMSYIDNFGQPSAPEVGAGLWLGSDSVTDGSWGYFVGHNPGDFANVMDLAEGDAVTVCDRDGAFRTYYVVDTFTVTTETYWDDIKDRVTGYGESIGLQCCVGDGAHYRVVVAI